MPQIRHNDSQLNLHIDEIEDRPQPVISFARELVEGEGFAFHQHKRAQLVYASHGVMTVTTRLAAYVVPPQRAVWMPAEIEHSINSHRMISMRSLYLRPSIIKSMPVEPCVLQISPLLRELIIACVAMGNDYQQNSPQARLVKVIIDQLCIQPRASLALPLPSDSRLLRITQGLMENPADSRILDDWADKVGASKRTINRLFANQTGMSFRSWRQQLRLHRAIELLAAGDTVTRVAGELGYDNTSAFIAMFRRCLGTTPIRYLEII